MNGQIERIPFHGSMLLAQKVDGDVFTALKPICEGMGIDPNGQMQRLKKQPWAVACVIHATGSDGKTYQMFGVNRKTLTMWLATIDTSRIKDPTVRHNVVTYQNECAEALDAYFNHGVAVRDHDDPDRRVRILSEAMLIAQQEMQSKDLTITRQQRELDERRPLALLGEAFVSTDGTMSVTQAARHFQTIDRRMTRDMIYGLLRGAGYVETHGNAPTKKAIKPGYLVQRQHIRDDRKLGKPYARFTTKGVNWFIRRFICRDGQPALEGGLMAEVELWSPQEAADCLGRSVKTLGKWRSLGRGPAYLRDSVSGRISYVPDVVLAWKKANLRRRTETMLGDCRRLK